MQINDISDIPPMVRELLERTCAETGAEIEVRDGYVYLLLVDGTTVEVKISRRQ